MIHARKDYMRIQDPLVDRGNGSKGIPKEEPVFLLRAQDILFVPMLTIYAILAEAQGCDARLVQTIRAHIELAKLWPTRKRADL